MYELTTATLTTNYWNDHSLVLRKEVNGEILITAQDVITAGLLAFHIQNFELFSKWRKKEIVRARFIIMYVMRLKVKVLNKRKQLREISLNKIGSYFHMDHTSVLHGINEIENDLSVAAYRQETNDQINSVIALI